MSAASTTKTVLRQIQEDDCTGMAAEMAYNLLLALPSIAVFILALFGLIGEQRQFTGQVLEYAGHVLPPSAMGFFQPLLTRMMRDSSGGLAVVAILAALWAASNGTFVIMKGIRHAYTLQGRKTSFVHDKLLALLLVFSLGLALFLASNLMIFGATLTTYISNLLNLPTSTELLINAVRWTVVIALILGFTTWVYSLVPSRSGFQVHMIQALPGALVFVGIWLLVSLLFSFYVENFGNYSQVYGALGAIVVMMVWLYISSLALLIGGEVNAVLNGAMPKRAKRRANPGENRHVRA